MAEPVLVVHGVANRDQSQFERQVKALNDRVAKSSTLFRSTGAIWVRKSRA
jgi:hypothetical protein